MRPEAEALFGKAARSLDNARRSFGSGDFDFAVSRAYYAMFYAAEALLLERGVSFSKHSAVISEFIRLFVRTGELPAAHGAAFKEAQEQRLVADYQFESPFPAARADGIIQRAAAFLTDAEEYLRRGAI